LQTTLLGIAIALIIALVAALVGPLFIDWSNYRPVIEAEAGRLVGATVHVAGPIDGRLLPSPRLTLHDVTVGQGANAIRAGELNVQFALTPLMRGQWQAEDLRLSNPDITVGVNATGHLQLPKFAFGFAADSLTVERLEVEGGKLTVKDAGGATTLTLDHIFFNGGARSLLGPFNGSGSLVAGGDHYSVDLATGRYGTDGMKLRVGLQPAEHPVSIDSDGVLTFNDGKPKFDGNLSLGPPPGMKSASPWHVGGKLVAGANSALLQNLQVVYGADTEAVKLTGSVRVDFGQAPSLTAELNTPRLDLDHMLAGKYGSHPTPAEALRKLTQGSGAAAFVSPLPMDIGLSADEVVLGGQSLRNVGGDFNSIDGGWNLQKLEFRAPGFSQVALSGKLAIKDDGTSFTGPAVIDATDPKLLFAWWQGREAGAAGDLKPLHLRGDVTFGTDKVAIQGMQARFDDKQVTGGLTYTYAAGQAPSKLDAQLKADDIDLDTAIALGKAMAAGSHAKGPQEIALKADLKHATLSGFSARDAEAALTYGRDGLRIENLSVADLGGAKFSAQGRIRFDKAGQKGSLAADLDAPDMRPVLAVLSRLAPQTADALKPAAAVMSPAKLHATFTVADGAPPSEGRLSLAGTLGTTRFALDGAGKVDLHGGTLGDVRVDGRLDADNGPALVSMLRLDRVFSIASGPGHLTFTASGPARGAMQVEAALGAGNLDASVKGTADIGKRSADLQVAVPHASAASATGEAVPVGYASRAVLAGNELGLRRIRATIGGAKLDGNLDLKFGDIDRVSGAIEADMVNAPPAVAAAIGLPAASPKADRWTWSSEPFAPGLIGIVQGDVAVKAHRLELTPQLAAREVAAKLHFGAQEARLDDVAGTLAGGALKGRLSFTRGDDGLQSAMALSVTGGDATALFASGARPPLGGTIGIKLEMAGGGLSPAALVGSLRGGGAVTLDNAQIAGLDPRAFDVITHAVDQGVPIETARVSTIVGRALESGELAVKHTKADLVVSAGQVRLNTTKAAAGDSADLTMSGALDLTNGLVDGHLVLSGADTAGGARPDIYMALKGPVSAPVRSVDVSALTGWLTLRAVDNEAEKLKAAEQAAAKARAAEKEAEAKVRAAAEAAKKEAAAGPKAPMFAPMSPPPVLLMPSLTAPPLPPPVSVQALPQPHAPAVR
jgi:large subunit ribosomal protein L24